MERVIDRFDKYLNYKGLTDYKATQELDISKSLLAKSRLENRDISAKTVRKILEKYSDINRVWLLTGEGDMLAGGSEVAAYAAPVISNAAARIDELLHHSQCRSLRSLASELGLASVQTLYDIANGRHGISLDLVAKVRERYPAINPDWLMSGTGDMLGSPLQPENEVASGIEVIPYVSRNITRTGNYNIRELVQSHSELLKTRSIGELVGSADLVQRVISSAMMPLFQPGDYVFIRFLSDTASLISGAIYMLDTVTYGTMIRQVYTGEGGTLRLHSLNPDYDELTMSRDEVRSISIVVKALRSDFNMPTNISTWREELRSRNAQIEAMIESQNKLIAELALQSARQDKLVEMLASMVSQVQSQQAIKQNG